MTDEIIDVLMKWLPLAGQLQKWGVGDELSISLATLIFTIAIFGIIKGGTLFFNHIRNSLAVRTLAPYVDYLTLKKFRQYFILTHFQNESPTWEEDEPRNSLGYIARSPLIPHFIKTVFNEKKDTRKFYLILAGSGMGKTTFMINLYVKYTAVLNFSRKYKIRFFPLGNAKVLDVIKKIDREEALKTILLLDAFDEDKGLLSGTREEGMSMDQRFHKRLDEILDAVQDFREVVITSRTQYFPMQEKQPYILKIPRCDEQGFHTLAKLYLSPFDSKEIRRYLRKKYGIIRFWNWKKKRIASRIVEQSPQLMVRPMLLGYMDYLVEDAQVFRNTADIYQTLVHKWIMREGKKQKSSYPERDKFMQDLKKYSHLVAMEIHNRYKEKDVMNTFTLDASEAYRLAEENNIDLADYDITGKSLLTRDAKGNCKFAHKSIFEFFVAKSILKDFSLLQELDFMGLDMVERFLREMYPFFPDYMDFGKDFVFIEGGTFLMGSPENEVGRSDDELQHEVQVKSFYMLKYTVTIGQFELVAKETKYKGSDCRNNQADKSCPVTNVSWQDAVDYCNWLTDKVGETFRLPTEAEWEYACRAGVLTPFSTGENLTTDQANYNGNHPYRDFPRGTSLGKTRPVGQYQPNEWGLFDMHGNVWEWCLDWYGKKYFVECKERSTADNPKGPKRGSDRVLRGGGWNSLARRCRSACRYRAYPDFRSLNVGFRPVFVPQLKG